jgi:molybdopterin synthase catalytic subunit
MARRRRSAPWRLDRVSAVCFGAGLMVAERARDDMAVTTQTVRVQTEAFDIAAEAAALTAGRTDIGAIVTFTGTVRGEAKGAPIRSMTLEHYPGMTEAELSRISKDAARRWPLQGTAIVHRVGELFPGDPIVLVVAASAHRQAAFDACNFLMDYLKTQAPFWKKETAPDGTGHWVDARDTDHAALDKWGG